MSFGVYIHYPYCRSRCVYCDFFAMTSPPPQMSYADAVAREMELRKSSSEGRRASSLYIGGGTPSLWKPQAMGSALYAARRQIDFECGAEWTVEADPGTVCFEDFVEMRKAGINRISLGAQSFENRLLRRLGRRHDAADIFRAAEDIQKADIPNFSLDLIYGLPCQNPAMARDDAASALSIHPQHLSIYELMVKDLDLPTALARDVALGRVVLPDEDEVFEMEGAVFEVLGGGGFQRYEISSFSCDPDHMSVHNRIYWNGGEYLGLGIGAVGFSYFDPSDPSRGGRRWQNHRIPKLYYSALERGELPESSSEILKSQTLFQERIQLGLRQCGGLDLTAAAHSLGIADGETEVIFSRCRKLEEEGLAGIDGNRIFLTRRGLDLHTEMVIRLLE